MSDLPTYVLERVFDAPRSLVWRSWTERELLSRWYGPGVETVTHRLDVEVGGLWLLEMKTKGGSHFQRVEYLEVWPPEKLVWLHTISDAQWNIISNPMMPDWPRVLLTTVTLVEAGTQTKLRLTWTPHDASDAEIACFAGAIAGMDQGWAAGMRILADMLAELQD